MGPQRFTAGITRRDFLVFSGLLAAGTFLPCQETYAVPDDLDQIYSKIISQIHKTPDPDMGLEDDVWATPSQTLMIYSCLDKLNRVQRLTGFGKFNYICMKKTLLLAWQRRKTGRFKGSEPETTIPFTTKEKDFMRSFFGLDAANYGFYGKRVVCDMEYSIRPDELQYMGGHYIRKGPAMDRFRKIKDQVERHPALVNLISDPVKNSLDMVITSGIRNIPKQMRLFFNKAVKLQGIPPQKYFYTIDYEKAEKQRVSINRIKDEFDALKKDISILQKNHVPYNLLKDTGIEFTFHRKPYLLN
ncbi:MAG TPA: hypothetical protein EYP57_09545, partial [Thermodesulfobacteriaceae bacterium]|nr:hypothetical protein [Thermodesulfobacteriaceae bacterium]